MDVALLVRTTNAPAAFLDGCLFLAQQSLLFWLSVSGC